MHVGMAAVFQNPGNRLSDQAVYRHEAAMSDLAEPLGFDSIWSAEHHFDEYTMCPNVAQFLTYMAGRTRRAKLGSMVMVLPWHDPVRLAEEISVLDNLSDGRVILGIGRGLGRIEYQGFRLDMGESRGRFTEYPEALLQGPETGPIEYTGTYYKHGIESFVNFLAELQVWGTPDQVYDKLAEPQRRADSGALIGIFNYGGMPPELAQHNLTLFAEKVLPRLQRLDAGCEIGGG